MPRARRASGPERRTLHPFSSSVHDHRQSSTEIVVGARLIVKTTMAARSGFAALLAICCILKCTTAQFTNGESRVLTPPYFNLAVGRNIQSSSTCGENVAEEELFCKLTGANPDTEPDLDEYTVIQGQLCDVCDPSRPDKAHPANQAIDGTKRWWQSPPLSRGIGLREVNLTIDLGQVSRI